MYKMESRVQKGFFITAKGYNNILYGFSKVFTFDIKKHLSSYIEIPPAKEKELTDFNKIQLDYIKIGNDMQKAITKYERTKL
ncbi:hypothetical protein DKP78_08305 [Enterococcus faecium]|nr:hypothetical protein DKP78_08305 [Enterococcus faecium]